MKKKYKLTSEVIKVGKHKLYRIQALRDFSDVRSGDLGGFVDTEDTIINGGDCWVSESARVYDNVSISGNSRVSGNACIFGGIWMFGNVRVGGDAYIYGISHRSMPKQIIAGNMEINSGIWNETIKIDGRYYLVSTTLQKILIG